MNDPPSPPKQKPLWFPDGNVVLATNRMCFRVHKSVLSLYSTVFRDMFDLPIAPGPADDEPDAGETSNHGVINPHSDLYDGLPLVKLSGDKDMDVVHLLRAIYERDYYDREDDTTPLGVIIAILTLSAKYDVATLRKDVLKQLSRNYPTTLAEYELVATKNATLFGRPRQECHFPLLRACVFSQADIQIILPTLLYSCSGIPFEKIMAHEVPLLALPTLRTLLIGARYLEASIRGNLCIGMETLISPTGCCQFNTNASHCRPVKKTPFVPAMEKLMSTRVISDIKGANVINTFLEKCCNQCRKEGIEIFETLRLHSWDDIPACFAMKSWDAVQGAK